jgi:hypothetical protein
VEETLERSIPFRAVVADSFYGEDEAFKQSLSELGVGYVLALKPSHAWWHKIGEIGSPYEAALAASEAWEDARHPGDWVKVVRRFTDGHEETWWALEVDVGPYYGPETRPWLEPIPDKERHSHKTPLAVGVLRVHLLLVGIWVLADRGDDGAGERSRRRIGRKGEKETPSVMAGGAPSGKGVAGALRNAMAILESVLWDVPTAGAKSTA